MTVFVFVFEAGAKRRLQISIGDTGLAARARVTRPMGDERADIHREESFAAQIRLRQGYGGRCARRLGGRVKPAHGER